MLRQISLDTETTGKSDDGTPGDHRIIEIGCVEIIDRKITGRQLQLYMNPERAVDEEAFEVHGISNEFLQDKPLFKVIAPEFIEFIRGAELLIHNAKFDVGFLNKEFSLLGNNLKVTDICTVTDTYTLARKYNPNNQASLDNLCNLYDIDNSSRTLHGALLDAQILAEVYLAMTGGQSSFNFGDDTIALNKHYWKRPANAKLPIMGVEQDRHAVHIKTMLELAQANKVSIDGQGDVALSLWSDKCSMPYLNMAEKEDKKVYKKRLEEQRAEFIKTLLNEEELQDLQNYLEADAKAYSEWVQRVKHGS